MKRAYFYGIVLVAVAMVSVRHAPSYGAPATGPTTAPATESTIAPSSPGADLDGDWAQMRSITPRHYVCRRATGPITIDGQAAEAAWADAPWTADFVDIEGDRRPAPRFRTRAKMLWDDDNFYIFAELEEPHVWGTITTRNQVIFHDNDFEVFINISGDNRNYHEFEMNALNTIWELSLDKPYRDGGPVHDPTNIDGLRSAVHVDGTLNNPSDTDRRWSVEIAIPWKGLARYAGNQPCPPTDGEQARIGFSRVEWLIDIIDGKYRKIPEEMRREDNWVWSPQGVIDMHRPERWGYVQFSASPATAEFHPDPTLGARDELMSIYYRQRTYRHRTGHYALSLADLGLSTADLSQSIQLQPSPGGYEATTTLKPASGPARTLHVREDSRLWEE